MSYYFHPAAEVDHFESVAYFESKRAGFGASYLAEFERIMGIVCETPHRYPVKKYPDEKISLYYIVSRGFRHCPSIGGCIHHHISMPCIVSILVSSILRHWR